MSKKTTDIEALPLDHTFTLPDHTRVKMLTSDGNDRIDVHIGNSPTSTSLGASAGAESGGLVPLLAFLRQSRKARVSLHGVVQASRAKEENVWSLIATQASSPEVKIEDVWAAIYAFWLRHPVDDRLPVELDAASLGNASYIYAYLTHTGLGFRAPDSQGKFELLLVRSSFWQGAGAPTSRNWLRSPEPHPALSGLPVFPLTTSFTQRNDPPVLTTHPLRPPKPAPGSIIYSRYIHAVGQHLELTHIDASNPEHFAAYSRWQNSDRVNVGWREKGSDEKHKKYLADRLEDAHIMGFVVQWDGVLAGYGEISWVKEDGMAAFVGGMGDYDQGTHLLIGEEKFRGRHRFQSVMVSMKHAAFLRDPRTEVVVGEPRADLPIVPLLDAYLPQEIRKEIELPHKRAVWFVLRRDRFFTEGIFN